MTIKNLALVFTFLATLMVVKAENFDKELEALKAEPKKFFDNRNWDALEKLFNEARSEKLTMTSGDPALANMYRSLDVEEYLSTNVPDERWEDWYRILDDWEDAYPDSITLPAVRLNFWKDYAWKARGNGWASTVKEDGWEFFKLRLEAADDLFENHITKNKGKPLPCPHMYCVASSIAIGQGWDGDEKDKKILFPTIKHYPWYLDTYRRLKVSYETKWAGAEGDDYRFLKNVGVRIGGAAGNEMYARLLLKEKLYEILEYQPHLVDWNMGLDGMVKAITNSPKSSYLFSHALRYAHKHDAQKELLKRVEMINPEAVKVLYKDSLYGKAIKQYMKNSESKLEFVGYLASEGMHGKDRIESLILDPVNDTALFAVGKKGVKEIAVESGKTLSSIRSGDRYAGKLVLSPDENTLLVISAWDKTFKNKDISLKIYSRNKAKNKVRKRSLSKLLFDSLLGNKIEDEAQDAWVFKRETRIKLGYIQDAIFLEDSDKIILSYNNLYEKKAYTGSEIYSWEWKDAKAKPVPFHKAPPNQVFSNFFKSKKTGRLLCTSRYLAVFDFNNLEEKVQILSKTGFLPKERIMDIIEFAPSGRLIALSVAKGQPYLLEVNCETGDVISRNSLNEVRGDVYHLTLIYDSENKPLIVTSGKTGSVSLWQLEEVEGKFNFKYESTIPTSGLATYNLTAYTAKNGVKYLLQGTGNGKIGLFKIK